MNRLPAALVFMALLALCQAAPLLEKPEEETDDDSEEGEITDEEHTGLEYDNYLRRVVRTLENDPDMRKKLEDISLEDLKNGEFTEIMDGVSDKIRARLDDLKRSEIQRLRQVARKRFQQTIFDDDRDQDVGGFEQRGHKAMDPKQIDDMVGHVDINNMEQFGGKDFEKLIQKATKDLDKADAERKEEFKRYEMQKEIDRREKLRKMDEDKRKQAEAAYEERHKKKKDKQMKHPGSKRQLEDVWEKTDHLDKDDFNPKTFFSLHDTNNDNYLDAYELEALFVKQVRSYYESVDNGNPDYREIMEEMARMREHVLTEVDATYSEFDNRDSREKDEEISRMREHVMNEIDTNKDKLVSKQEFMAAATADDFEEDKDWEDIDEMDLYTEDELKTYKSKVNDEMLRLKMKMQKEHDTFREKQEQQQAGQPVQMNQGILDPKTLVNKAPSLNVADLEAEGFHKAVEQVKMVQNLAQNVAGAEAQGPPHQQETQHLPDQQTQLRIQQDAELKAQELAKQLAKLKAQQQAADQAQQQPPRPPQQAADDKRQKQAAQDQQKAQQLAQQAVLAQQQVALAQQQVKQQQEATMQQAAMQKAAQQQQAQAQQQAREEQQQQAQQQQQQQAEGAPAAPPADNSPIQPAAPGTN